MDAIASLFASSATAAWSRPSGAIGRLLRWLRSQWHTRWQASSPRGVQAAPTRFFEARVNGRSCALPMQGDSLGRCEAVAAACELANLGPGLETALISTRMSAARVWVSGCEDGDQAPARIAAMAGQLLQIGMEGSPQRWMPLGCIPALEVHEHGSDELGVTPYTECGDAMGRSAIEAAARAMAAPLAALVGCSCEPVIQLGDVQATRVKVRCRVSVEPLLAAAAPTAILEAPLRALGDEALSWFGIDRHEPELAAAHNDFIIEGVNAAATALGLEAWRFSAGARSHAARWGSCEPLARWRRQGQEICGLLELPVDLDSACGALPCLEDEDARREVARRRVQLVACVGLLASLAHVRAVIGAVARQRAFGSGEAPPVESAARGRSARDPAIAESGVRLIASDPAATRAEAG